MKHPDKATDPKLAYLASAQDQPQNQAAEPMRNPTVHDHTAVALKSRPDVAFAATRVD